MRNGKVLPKGRSACFFAAVFFAGLSPSWADPGPAMAPPPQGGSTITIASYNAENLWDHDPQNTPDAWEEFLSSLSAAQRANYSRPLQYADYAKESSNWYSKKVLEAKAQHFVTTISLMENPDIVGLQEIESAGNTSAVFDMPYRGRMTLREKLEEMGYRYLLMGPQEKTNPVAVTTAFISKLPIKNLAPVVINFGNTTSCRDIQVVELSLPSGRALLFNSHWKSKNGGYQEVREKTALTLAKRIADERKADPRTDVIALGDFNSSYHESPMLALRSTGDERKMFGRPTPYLYNLWFSLPGNHRWDYSYDGARQVLSSILISDGLYDHQGLQYIPHSYTVVGQQGDAARVLLNVDGRPFRWQITKRGRKSIHLGRGYSDHLPLRASFIVHGSTEDEAASRAKEESANPSTEEGNEAPREIILDEVDRCDPATARDLRELPFAQIEKFIGSCVKIELTAQEEALPLHTWGTYRATYVELSPRRLEEARNGTLKIGLAMTRAYDWRPNLDDSRVTRGEVMHPEEGYHGRKPHPRSNQCFVRKILQGAGGAMRKFLGKLGYHDGHLSIFAVTREAHDMVLEQLPDNKARSCLWAD
jgi:hypothetical protein